MSVFSHSRIEAFETCPKKYEFSYVLREPRGPSGIEAFMGSRVHEALEWLYAEVRACRLPAEEELLARFHEAWEAEWDDGIPVVRSDRTPADYRAMGEKALADYHRRYHPFDQGVTVGLELRVALRLDEGHELTGFIDRLTKVSDGVWEIHDYKTSGTLMTQDKADADRQLALYELAVREMYPDARQVDLVWHYLVFDHEVRSSRSSEQLETLRHDILERVRHIEAQTEFPTKSSRLCEWCDFRRTCPAWRHMFAVADGGGPLEEVADVALVDRYFEVSDAIATMESEREGLKRRIVERADEDGLDRLFGTEGSLKVFRYESACLPDAKDPRRVELERILREDGLFERYAQLSAYHLSKDITGDAIPSETMDRIRPFVRLESGSKIYPSRRTALEPKSA